MKTPHEGFARYAPQVQTGVKVREECLESLPVVAHVTPSTSGAARRESAEYAARSRSMVAWWRSAVNFIFLSFCRLTHALERTGRDDPVLSPGRVLLGRVPVAGPLPSAASAVAEATLFGGFVGTAGLSDLCGPSVLGLGLMAFPTRRRHPESLDFAAQYPARTCPCRTLRLRPREPPLYDSGPSGIAAPST